MTTLESLQGQIEELKNKLNQPIFNLSVAAGAGIMPSKIAAALNSGQTAALISGNTMLQEDIQDLRTFMGSMTAGTANKVIKSDGTNWVAGTITDTSGALAGVTSLTMAGALSGVTTLALSAAITSTSTTDATSINTGSIITDGGVGIEKAAWIGGLMNVAGIGTFANTTDATSISTGGLIASGGLGVTKALWVGGLANIAGAVTMQSTLAVTSTINSQTISSAANFTGSVVIATNLTLSDSLLDLTATNNVGRAISARYNGSNNAISFNINNANGNGLIASNANAKAGSATSTFDISNIANKLEIHDQLVWSHAASGTAGNDITWVDKFTVTNAGNGTFAGTLTVSGASITLTAGDIIIGGGAARVIRVSQNATESDLTLGAGEGNAGQAGHLYLASGRGTGGGGVSGNIYLGYGQVGGGSGLGHTSVTINGATDAVTLAGTLTVSGIGAFVAGDKYVTVDANGLFHKSAVGPAS